VELRGLGIRAQQRERTGGQRDQHRSSGGGDTRT
jgi:hypothetical protein